MEGFEYVDDILNVHDKRFRETENILEQFNNIHCTCTLNYSTVEENETSINSLDVTFERMENHINVSIFRTH